VRRSFCGSVVSLGFLGVISGFQARSQAAEVDAASGGEAGSYQIGEVVVTAQRRAESMQSVPISVSSISGDQLKAVGVTDTTQLNGQVPSLSIDVVGSGNLIYLRGIGTDNTAVNAEASVATYIDGVYLYSANGNILPLFDLDRVEVLKGPQGTLFGRNATGGVIQIITREPSQAPSVETDIGIANYKTVTAHVYATSGITDNLAFNVSIDMRQQGDGWGYNPVRQEDAFFSNHVALRSKLLYTPSEDTRVEFAIHYSNIKSSGFEAQVPNGVVGPDGVVGNYSRFEYLGGAQTRDDSKYLLTSLRIEQNVEFARLVSITGYSNLNYRYPTDADYTPTPIVDANVGIYANNLTEELQLQSNPGSRIQWTAGAYFFNASAAYNPLDIVGSAVGGAMVSEYAEQKTHSISGFAQATADLFAETRLTLGARYTSDTLRRVDARLVVNGDLAGTGADQKNTDGIPTWRVSLDHNFAKDVMGYLSYTRGSKTGGYNIDALTDTPAYAPEKVDAFELGLKSEFFDRHLRFNFAAFLDKFKNIQVTQELGPALNVSNAASATIHGLDMDFVARPLANLTISGSFGYTVATFDSYSDAVGFHASVFDGPSFVFDAHGNTLPYAAKFSGGMLADYAINSTVGEIDLIANAAFQGKRYVAADNRLALPAYTLANASINWSPVNAKYTLKLWAENLFDRRYLAGALEGGSGDFIVPSAPRTYGLNINFKM
jgi:iron complex outermembrane recepter protein